MKRARKPYVLQVKKKIYELSCKKDRYVSEKYPGTSPFFQHGYIDSPLLGRVKIYVQYYSRRMYEVDYIDTHHYPSGKALTVVELQAFLQELEGI